MSRGQARLRARHGLRRLVWRIWPTLPSEWSQVLPGMRPATVQIGRLTGAAVISYLVATGISPKVVDLTAPLTALLVVQASTVGTLRMGLVRVGAVLTGVLVAVAVASYLGLSWWSLALVIVASLLLAKVMRLGEQSLEAPISAMLILAVSAPQVAAEVRVLNTLIGTLVGITFSLLVPVAVPNARARDAVRRVARSQAALLDEVATTLGDRPPDPEEAQAWSEWGGAIADDISHAAEAVDNLEESRLLNPRALAAARIDPGLRSALERLTRCLAAERALILVIGREGLPGAAVSPRSAELRRAFAVVLDDLATGLRAFGDVIGAREVSESHEAVERIVEVVHETRAVLTELVLLDVDPQEDPEVWMLQGSVLAAVNEILRQLDLELAVESSDAWVSRHSLTLLPKSWRPVSRRRSDGSWRPS